MSYFDRYKRIVGMQGTTYKEEAIINIGQSFNQMLEDLPNSYTINKYKDNTPYQVIIRDTSEMNFGGDKKYLLAKLTDSFMVGDLISWSDKYWLMTMEETQTVPVYQKLHMYPCNSIIKWVHENNIEEYPCLLTVTKEVSWLSENTYAYELSGTVKVQTIFNEATKNIKEGMRFILSNREVFRVSKTDISTSSGLLSMIFEKCDGDYRDDLVNNIAYNGEDISIPTEIGYSIQIIGNDVIEDETTSEYSTLVYNNGNIVVGNVTWALLNFNGETTTDGTLTVVGNTCTIKGNVANETIYLYAYLSSDNSVFAKKEILIGSVGW